MKRKIGLVAVAVLLTVGSFGLEGISPKVLANSELRNEISDVENERQQLKSDQAKTQAELDKLKEEMQELTNEIERLDEA